MDSNIWLNIAALSTLQIAGISTAYITNRILRRILAGFLLVAFGVGTGLVIGYFQEAWCISLAYIAFFQLINIARIVESRMNHEYLLRQVKSTGYVLVVLLAITPLFKFLLDAVKLHNFPILFITSLAVLICSILVFTTLLFHMWRSRTKAYKLHYSDDELPTLSVLIPARNEDEQLHECLHQLIKSDYPKLEVIVLDDCSQDKSSDIIRRFANKGVRFIQGEAPAEKWLAKNQAYDALAAAASGEILLFSGVDVRFGSDAFRKLVTTLIDHKLEMASLLPRRKGFTSIARALFPLRYWWELAVPRDIINRPPVLSTCWLIKSDIYKELGGFSAVAHSVEPESYFARELQKKGSYAFLRTNRNDEAVMTVKELREQYETAIRTRYPQLHKNLVSVMTLLLIMLGLWFWPFIGVFISFARHNIYAAAAYALASILLLLTNVTIVYSTSLKRHILAGLLLPYTVIQELVIILLSMYKYEFSEVIWKGRNVCYPVMHIVPRLPKIESTNPGERFSNRHGAV